MQTTRISEKILKGINVLTDVDVQSEDFRLLLSTYTQPIIVVQCDKNFKTSVVEKKGDFSLFDVHPTKRDKNKKTDFFTIDDVIEYLTRWIGNFTWALDDPNMIQLFDNSSFVDIIIYKHENGFLWCNADFQSYTKDDLASYIFFQDEFDQLVELGKENMEFIEKSFNELEEGSIIIQDINSLIKTKLGIIPYNKEWFDDHLKVYGVDKLKSDIGEASFDKFLLLENQLKWYDLNDEPPLNTKVVVKLDNDEITLGQVDDDVNRKTWLILGTGGMYWRSFTVGVVQWRYMTESEKESNIIQK